MTVSSYSKTILAPERLLGDSQRSICYNVSMKCSRGYSNELYLGTMQWNTTTSS